MSRRALILRELGLTPLWVRRRGAPRADQEVPAQVPRAQQAAAPAAGEIAPNRHDKRTRSIETQGVATRGMDWPELEAAVAACTACTLHKQRTRTVFGVGDCKAEWLFVGEGPGAEEDARGEPFVGQAGKLLDSMLASIGLKRGDNVYIANVVKCRPPANRNPSAEEALACEPYLTRQIELIGPRLIIALGKVAAQNLLGTEATIASLRGRTHQLRGTPLIVTYHPAYLLRTLADKARAWEDLCFAVQTMQALKAGTPGSDLQAS
jgi:uracil-DNA glycosylase